MELTIKQISEVLEIIYFDNPTEKQISAIRQIISVLDCPVNIGNNICDYLGIERRGNRQIIAKKIIQINSEKNENGIV